MFQAICRKGLVAQGDGRSLVETLVGPWDHKKRSYVQIETWCAGETLAMSLTWGAHGLSGWVCYFLSSIYTHMFFFIYRSKLKQVYKSSMEKVVFVT